MLDHYSFEVFLWLKGILNNLFDKLFIVHFLQIGASSNKIFYW